MFLVTNGSPQPPQTPSGQGQAVQDMAAPVLVPQSPKPAVKKPEELLAATGEDSLTPFSRFNSYDLKLAEEFGVSASALKYICLGSSSYEIAEAGWHDKQAAPYYLKLFRLYEANGGFFTRNCFPSKILPLCEELAAFWKRFEQGDREGHAKELADSIHNLKPGCSTVMGSGYAGDPSGHAMIIRFIKIKEGSYDVHVYDGTDSSEWSKKKNSNHKDYGHPYTKFEGVANQDLFFSSSPAEPLDPIILLNLLKLLERTNRAT